MDFASITDHPDYDEIVSKIVTGVSTKDISNWLKVKYSDKDQKHLQLSAKLLQDFADTHVDLEAHLKSHIMMVKSGDSNLINNKIADSLMNQKTYRERLIELADSRIDAKKLINDLVITCTARMEQIFDKIQENPTNTKGDYILLKYFETLFIALEKFDKIVNNAPDQIIQHNVTVQAVEQHSYIFQEAIRETLAQIDAESAILFMEIFIPKLQSLKVPEEKSVTTKDMVLEATLLEDLVASSEKKKK